MRIIHTIASIRSEHGGTSRSVPALCEVLPSELDVHLIAGTVSGGTQRVPVGQVNFHGVPEPPFLGRLRVGAGFRARIDLLVQGTDEPVILHDHGIWLASNHASAVAAAQHKLKRIVAPRGMLSPWSLKNSKIKKALPWWLYQYRDLKQATAFHATSELEAAEIRALGFRQPIAVIANGVDRPAGVFSGQRSSSERRTMLFLSRVHPKKGLLNLLEAWKTSGIYSSWNLVIAGPDEGGHLRDVLRRAADLGVDSMVEYAGVADDTEKWQLYANAELFVLPSFSENFGIVVAEALAAGLPVLTTTGTPWKELEVRSCGWCVEPTVESLTSILRTIAECPQEQLVQMGNRGQVWVNETFGWSAIGVQMSRFYRWLLNGGSKPDFVISER